MKVEELLKAFKGNKSLLAKHYDITKGAVSKWPEDGEVPELRVHRSKGVLKEIIYDLAAGRINAYKYDAKQINWILEEYCNV